MNFLENTLATVGILVVAAVCMLLGGFMLVLIANLLGVSPLILYPIAI